MCYFLIDFKKFYFRESYGYKFVSYYKMLHVALVGPRVEEQLNIVQAVTSNLDLVTLTKTKFCLKGPFVYAYSGLLVRFLH